MLPVARMTDTFSDGDMIQSGSGNVFINSLPAARMTDTTTGHGPPPCWWPSTIIVGGSGSVFVNGLPLARMTDKHAVHCCGPACHDAMISSGSGNVFSG